MGASESRKLRLKEHEEACSMFSPEILESIHCRFSHIASLKGGGNSSNLNSNGHHDEHGSAFNRSQFKHYCESIGLPNRLIEPLFQKFVFASGLPASKEHLNEVSQRGYILALGKLLKGDISDHCRSVKFFTLSQHQADDLHEMNAVTKKEIVQFLEDAVGAFVVTMASSPEANTWSFNSSGHNADALMLALLEDLTPSGGEGESEYYDDNSLQKWLTRNALVPQLWEAAFFRAFAASEEAEELPGGGSLAVQSASNTFLPTCDCPKNFRSVLCIPSMFFLSQLMPAECRHHWKLLFATSLHGESFSQMLAKIMNKGPTLLVVRDKAKFIFGGFASQSWMVSPQFFGNENCFLFTLNPSMKAYFPTGYSQNYCYLNVHQQTLPNGLGMGGQIGTQANPVHYFGLWLNEQFGTGKSQGKSTCFGNSVLAATADFEVDSLEFWGVNSPAEGASFSDPISVSILDKDPEAKALLSFAGKGPLSEGMRESDIMATSEDQPADYSAS